MATDPLQPRAGLLCKLSSLIVHADEFLSPIGRIGRPLDRTAFNEGVLDQAVAEWISQMDSMAMLPKKR